MTQLLTSLVVIALGAAITGVTYLLQRTGHCCGDCQRPPRRRSTGRYVQLAVLVVLISAVLVAAPLVVSS